MPRAPQNADAAGAATANREHALAEDREQQQDAGARPPTCLHQHEGRDMRMPPDVAEPVHEIAKPGELHKPAKRWTGGGSCVVPRRGDERRRGEKRQRVDHEREIPAEYG